MSDETIGPASGAEAPVAAAEVATPEAPASPPEQSAQAPTSQEPDFDALLKHPDYRKRLLEHPELQTEFQRHRSEAGRRAKAELENYQRQVKEWWEQQQTSKLKEMDSYELGEQRKRELAEQESQAAQMRFRQEVHAQVTAELIALIGQEAAQHLDPEDYAQLDPRRYHSATDFLKAAIPLLPKKQAQQLAKEIAKKEIAAGIQEGLGEQREKAPSVPNILNTGPGLGDKDFLAAYSRGDSDDHKRARALLGGL